MAESQINLDELDQYSQAFARRLTDYFFIDHKHIEGADIIKFCDIKQVNLFIIKNLFEAWQVETAKLKSPFFNYENPKVQSALKTFMNVLSQYIHIPKQHFYPLLREATLETLLLVLDPKKFFSDKLKNPNYQPITTQRFIDIKKYVKYNKPLLENFIAHLSHQDRQEFTTSQSLTILEKAYEEMQDQLEPKEWVLQNFSDILALDPNKILPGNNASTEPGGDQTHVLQETSTVLVENSVNAFHNPSDGPRSLNDVFKEGENGDANLHEKFQQAKLDNIRSAISLNQKFLFMNHLFNGDSFAFNDAINKIEDCENFDEARKHISKIYALKFDWDMNSEEVQDFLGIIERRFR